MVEHISQAEFRRSGVGYKDCLDAFSKAAVLISGRDFIEEFVCAKIWPLAASWGPDSFVKAKVHASKEALPFPTVDLVKPPEETDEAIVVGIERRAAELAGPYLSKEYEYFVLCCPDSCRVNRSLVVMGVKYVDREEPEKPEKRSKGAPSEEPAAKKRKVSSADAAGSSKATPKVLVTRPPRPPPKVTSKKGNHMTGTFRVFLVVRCVVSLFCGN